ncbi:VirD4-like conjugal transfer protein, CD1115 family [Defluviitalea phaphyphila]|uniref:VirD4-like conjugal transfer protein, CD1115 family n=1 Tax=Defluviitalea phaphyphila TaxID=1473580 RepID=UPI000730A6F5|nr:type IV secretory system conjugative DNA transfer family protein [Defluviitalea phaphyphila]
MKKKKSYMYFSLILSIVAAFLFNRVADIYQKLEGNILEKISTTMNEIIPSIKKNIFYINVDKSSLIFALIGFAVIWLIYFYNVVGAKKYMHGIEHGSAEWGTKKDIKKYIDKKNFYKNIIFTQTERMTLDTRQTFRNNNVLVVGGSGSGKTRFYVKPNIMQMHSSYVITDPKGSLLKECGKMLVENGYKVKVFDLINMQYSDKYNPFNYIKEEKDILKLITNLITNTNSPQSKNAGDFWEKAETALLQALFGYVFYEASPEERNIGTVMEMIRLAEVREDDEDFKSPLDIMFEDLKEENPDHFAVKQYDLFKLAAGKTAKSILVSLGVRLSPFYIQSLQELVSEDTIELDMIGSEKTALFVILPDTDKTFNFMAAIMYQQLFDILFYKADNEYNGRLPFHVRFLLDEFANIGQIPNFEIYIATMRSREISVNVILQNIAQLKGLYKDHWETITGNCDTLLFLGGKEQSTLEYISKMIGKTTIDNMNVNETKGQSGSYSLNYQILGRDLITPDEVGRLEGTECILSIRGEKPFKSRKFDITKHSRYKFLSDYDKTNTYDISKKEKIEAENFLNNVDEVEEVDLSELNTLI